MLAARKRAASSVARSTVESIQAVNPTEIFESVQVQLANEPFALCALDQAVYDLWGKQKGKPVYELWGLDPNDAPRSNFTIGIDSIAAMIAKLEEALCISLWSTVGFKQLL